MRSVVDRNVVMRRIPVRSLGTMGRLAGATTHFRLVRGALPPPPHKRSWHGI
jgi:hypothetical protein